MDKTFRGLWWQKKYCQDSNATYYAFYKSIDYVKAKGKDFTLLIWIPTDTRGLRHLDFVTPHMETLLDAVGTEFGSRTFISKIEPSVGHKLWEMTRDERDEWKERRTQAIQKASMTSSAIESNSDYKKSILAGNIFELPELPKRQIITFLSSTFLDTRNERDVYWDDVHPYLVSLCRQLGLSYVVVDMRWGVKHIAADNHETLKLCLDNVNYCRQNSIGAYFVSILGQRRGYEPFPVSIEEDLFDEFLKLIEADTVSSERSTVGLENIKEWFKLDTSFQPPLYVLQNISWKFGKYGKIPQEWWDAYDSMQKAFKKASYKLSDRFSKEAYKFQVPITEAEVREALFKDSVSEEDRKNCFIFDISISGINPKDDIAKNFADLIKKDGITEVNAEALSSMKVFKSHVKEILPAENLVTLLPSWHPDGMTAEKNSEYLRNFADKFCNFMVQSALDGVARANISTDTYYSEALQHNTTWINNCEEFVGGIPTLDRIKELVSQCSHKPLILHGPSGSGKTFFMSKASMQVTKELAFRSCIILYLGTSPGSSSARAVMTTLCHRLSSILDVSSDHIPKRFEDLVKYLQKLLKEVKINLCIALDALDQLTDEDSGRDLKWLPTDLPPNIFLLLSTIHEEDPARRLQHIERCFDALHEASIPEENFIRIPELKKDDMVNIIEHWLEKDKRKLTKHQFSSLLSATEITPSPLYLKLAYAEAIKWHSYTPVEEAKIPTSISGILDAMFSKLEQHHGKAFVSHAFAYITSAKHGLSLNELQDILSCDEEVLDEVFEYFSPPVRRLPPHVWLSLKAALGPYIVERGAQGETVYGWYHRQFWEKVQERYLDTIGCKRSADMISSYFLCELEGNLPYVDKKTGFQVSVCRNVTPQKLILLEGDRKRQQNPVYNLRKMVELPHALLAARRGSDLEELLCDLDFITAMCAMNMHYDLIDIMLEGLNNFLSNSGRLRSFLVLVQANAVELSKYPHLIFQEALNDSRMSSGCTYTCNAAEKYLKQPPKNNEYAIIQYVNKKRGEDPVLFTIKAIYEPNAHARIYQVKLIGEDGLAVSFGVTNRSVDYGTVRTFSATNGRELATLVQGKKIGKQSLCCTSDGKYLCYQADDTVFFVDIEDLAHPKKVFEYNVGNVNAQTSFSSTGCFCVYHTNGRNSFDLITPGTWTISRKEISCCQPNLSTVFFTDDGNLLFCMINTGRQDVKPVMLMNLVHPEKLIKVGKLVTQDHVYESYRGNMLPNEVEDLSRRGGGLEGWITKLFRTVALSEDGKLAALGFWNGSIHVFDMMTGKVAGVMKRPPDENKGKYLFDENWNVLHLKFHPNDNVLLVTYGDNTFRAYNADCWMEEFMFPRFGNSCQIADLPKNSDSVISVNHGNHKIQHLDWSQIWILSELDRGRPFFSTKVHQNVIVQFSGDGDTVSMVVDKFSKIIHSETGACMESNEFESKCKVKVGSKSKALFPQHTGNNLLLKRINIGTGLYEDVLTLKFKGQKSPLVCSFLPNSGNIVVLTSDSRLAIYNSQTGEIERECSQSFEGIADIKCTYHETVGERIALVGSKQSVCLLSATCLEPIAEIEGFNSSSYGRTDSFCVSLCGRGISTRGNMQGGHLAIATTNETDKVDTYEMKAAVISEYLSATAVCPDKMLFAAAGWEGDMNLFDLNTRRAIKQLTKAETQINTTKSMSFSPCSKYLISNGGDGATLADGGHVRLWNADNLQLLGLFNSRSGTNMTCMDVHWFSKRKKEPWMMSGLTAKVACLDWSGEIYILDVFDRLTDTL